MRNLWSREARSAWGRSRFLFAVLVLSLPAACEGGDPDPAAGSEDPDDTDTVATALERAPRAGGATSCDFDLPAEMDPAGIGPIIERDRMYMAARPGMIVKHLPFSLDPTTFRVQTGGRYLFDTAENARAYVEWLRAGFLLDGFYFLQRPFFINPRCTAWRVVGWAEWLPRSHHYLMRTERLRAPPGASAANLGGHWARIRQEARRRGLAAVRLNHSADPAGDRVEIVEIADRSLAGALAMAAAPLGGGLQRAGWQREFDRVQLVMTIWYPFEPGDRGPAALWPNSPPLPAPSCGDGVCEVSRGEDGMTCGGDCPAACGDAVCQAGESTQNCPGDCRLP